MKYVLRGVFALLFCMASFAHASDFAADSVSSATISAEAFTADSTASEVKDPDAEGHQFAVTPFVGLTVQHIRNSSELLMAAEWVVSLEALHKYRSGDFRMHNLFFARLDQVVELREYPQKMANEISLTLTPSYPVFGSEVFLQALLPVGAETKILKGLVKNRYRNYFADPLFVYQMPSFGYRKEFGADENGTSSMTLTLGAGYAIQETFTRKFPLRVTQLILESTLRSLTVIQPSPKMDHGPGFFTDLRFSDQLTEDLAITAQAHLTMFGREDFYTNSDKTRVSVLLLGAATYGIVALDYSMRYVYDHNYSERSEIEQVLVLGVRLEL